MSCYWYTFKYLKICLSVLLAHFIIILNSRVMYLSFDLVSILESHPNPSAINLSNT